MQVKIGSTLFIGGESKYQLAPPVEGLEAPDIRIGDGVYAGRDGGYVSGHFYGYRTIVLNGFYIGDNCQHATQLRQDLFRLLRIRYRLPILVTDFAGNVFYTEGYIDDIKCDVNNPVAGEFQLSLICPDPFFYEAQGENPKWYEYTLNAGSSISIPNEGTVEALPIITIQGGVVNPVLTNETTLESISLDLTTQTTDTLTINMEKRLILVNDEAVNETRSIDSSWWKLIQGANIISLSADEFSGSIEGLTVNSYQIGAGTTLTTLDTSAFENNVLDWINTQGGTISIPPVALRFGYVSASNSCNIAVESTMAEIVVKQYDLADSDAEAQLRADATLLGINSDVSAFLNDYNPSNNYTGTLDLDTDFIIAPDVTAKIKLKKGYAGI